LNGRRARETERLLRQRLDRQSVAVPAKAARDIMAAHRLVARNDILDRSGQQMAIMRQSRGERRAVIEDKLLAVLADFERLLEGILLLPELENLFLHPRKTNFAGNC